MTKQTELSHHRIIYEEGRRQREAEILEMIDELLEESKRLKEYGWIDGVELKTNLQEKFK